MWSIWMTRNEVKHNGCVSSPNLMWLRICSYMQAFIDPGILTLDKYSLIFGGDLPLMKINTDASFVDLAEWAANGWIARDDKAVFVRVGRCTAHSSLMAEARAVLEALHWALREGWTRVWIESDSLLLVRALQSGDTTDILGGCWQTLLADIRRCIPNRISVVYEHVPREAYGAADWIAKSVRCNGDFILTDSCTLPALMEGILRLDAA